MRLRIGLPAPKARAIACAGVERSAPWAALRKRLRPDLLAAAAGRYAALTKPRLSCMVVSSAIFGYMFCAAGGALQDPVTLAALTLGTSLTSGAANVFNQYLEQDTDGIMARTQRRPIPSGRVGSRQAFTFGVGTGTIGMLLLSAATPVPVAALGLANLALYALVYTPIKRISPVSMWVGSVVGGIPPIMGSLAATDGIFEPTTAAVAAILLLWQPPHFFVLSWLNQNEYRVAGYAVHAVRNPGAIPRQHFLALVGLLAAVPAAALVAGAGALAAAATVPLSLVYLWRAWRFWMGTTVDDARTCFRLSILWLPTTLGILLGGKMLSGKGGEEGQGG